MLIGKLTGICFALFILTSCSYQWTASVRVKSLTGQSNVPLRLQMTNSLGEHVYENLSNGCVEVHIGQHPKLPNKIHIAIYDVNGTLVGSANTHDLANQRIEIPLANAKGTVIVTPRERCSV